MKNGKISHWQRNFFFHFSQSFLNTLAKTELRYNCLFIKKKIPAFLFLSLEVQSYRAAEQSLKGSIVKGWGNKQIVFFLSAALCAKIWVSPKVIGDAAVAFSNLYWNQQCHETPYKFTKSKLLDVEITRGHRSPHLYNDSFLLQRKWH